MVKVSVIANLFFLLTKNDIIVHYNKVSNLGVYRANFPNLKGPRAPSQNCNKFPAEPPGALAHPTCVIKSLNNFIIGFDPSI